MVDFLDAEPGADSTTSLHTPIYGEEKPIPSVPRQRRSHRHSYLSPASPSNTAQLRLRRQAPRSYSDIPNELWYFIFEFLIPSDITPPTHHTLVHVRGVCRWWREIAERLIWGSMKSLVASSRLFDSPSDDFPHDYPHEIQLWLEESITHLVECSKRDAHCGGAELRLVAFHLDGRYHPDQDLAKFFVSALSKCVRADITIDHFSTSSTPCSPSVARGIRSLPTIPLRQFSFSSVDLGIRDTLPQQFDFPWHSLRQELPWSQLTDITLDCVLSYDDALVVLSAAVNAGRAELGRLSSPGLSQGCSSAMANVISTLHTLKINTSIDLRPLFSRLELPALEDLQLAVYLDSIPNAPIHHILTPNLNVRWHGLKKLSLRSGLTYRQCDLDGILQHCHQLKQLKWEGDRSEFNDVDLPLGALTQLEELVFASDPAGHQHFFKDLGFLPDITKLSLSHYHPLLTGSDTLPNLSHIVITGAITLVHLFQILRSRTRRLLSGEFRVDTTVTQFCLAPLRCEVLQGLKLILANVASFPWGKLHAPQLRTLGLNLKDGVHSSTRMRREMEPFRSAHLDTIISISAS